MEEKRFPNLLIIGAMKCGTSSLHDYLNQHPDVFMSREKEIHYYADANFKKEKEEEYLSHFNSNAKILGTTPQSYTKCHNKYYQNIPERIARDTPDVKLIYIVRDPIERYKSHVLESYHCDPPEDILYSQESDNYFKTGLYAMQLKAFLLHFTMKQICVISLEELKENRLEVLNGLFEFLEIPKLKDATCFDFQVNRAQEKLIPLVIKTKFWYRLGVKLNQRLTVGFAEKIAKKYFKIQTEKPILSELEEGELRARYRGDVKELRAMTGKSFKMWSL